MHFISRTVILNKAAVETVIVCYAAAVYYGVYVNHLHNESICDRWHKKSVYLGAGDVGAIPTAAERDQECLRPKNMYLLTSANFRILTPITRSRFN